jgi:hypothetical protein
MTDDRPNNHLLLSVWLLGVAYGHERQPATEKAKTVPEGDIHKDAKALWRGIVNGNRAEAVQWLDGCGATGIGQARDAVDATLEALRKRTRDKLAAELRAKISYGTTEEDLIEGCKAVLAKLT